MGKKDGFGKYFWSNGSVYEGNFKNGQIEGKGKDTQTQANSPAPMAMCMMGTGPKVLRMEKALSTINQGLNM